MGGHCLGGAYAASSGLLSRADLFEWKPWVGTWVGEDVMLGVLAHAGGLRIRGDVDPGGTFALAWQNLPLPPERLIEGGYSVVHSVRDQRYGDEPSCAPGSAPTGRRRGRVRPPRADNMTGGGAADSAKTPRRSVQHRGTARRVLAGARPRRRVALDGGSG